MQCCVVIKLDTAVVRRMCKKKILSRYTPQKYQRRASKLITAIKVTKHCMKKKILT